MIRRILMTVTAECLFANRRWYRRYIGGRWERWWISPTKSPLWFRVAKISPDDHRMPASEGPRMEREDYP